MLAEADLPSDPHALRAMLVDATGRSLRLSVPSRKPRRSCRTWARSLPRFNGTASERVPSSVWSRRLMVHHPRMSGRRHYGPGFTWERHDARGRASSEQHGEESLRALAKRHGVNQKTIIKWRKRTSTADLRTGPKEPRSTTLTIDEEAVVVAFRRHTLLPLDDCLYALQATIPHLTRSSLHRCLQRHGISRLPEVDGDKPVRAKFKAYPIGYFHVDLAEVRTEQGKLYLLVAIDRTSKFAFVELHEKATRRIAGYFLRHLAAAVPYRIHTVLTVSVR